jgi:hypothetical protein
MEMLIFSEIFTNCLNSTNSITILNLIETSQNLPDHDTLVLLCKVSYLLLLLLLLLFVVVVVVVVVVVF